MFSVFDVKGRGVVGLEIQYQDQHGGGEGRKEGERGGDGRREGEGVGGGERLKCVLSLWREKVFGLLVQTKVKELHHNMELHETQRKVNT